MSSEMATAIGGRSHDLDAELEADLADRPR